MHAWVRAPVRIHVDNEIRVYLGLPAAAELDAVRDEFAKAIRGEGYPPIYGDQGVMLLFASCFSCTIVCWFPPRQTAERETSQ